MIQDLPIIPLHMPITNVVVNNRIEGLALIHSHMSLENAIAALDLERGEFIFH